MDKKPVKIVTIGGGSSYTPELMEGFIKRYDELPIREIWLVDIEEGKEKLEIVGTMAQRMWDASPYDVKVHLTLDRREALKDAVFTCCEQSGAYETFNIEDPELINTICASVAEKLEGVELTHPALSNALGEGFAVHGFEVKGDLASTFASAFISSYR